jgi:hypothetical protein
MILGVAEFGCERTLGLGQSKVGSRSPRFRDLSERAEPVSAIVNPVPHGHALVSVQCMLRRRATTPCYRWEHNIDYVIELDMSKQENRWWLFGHVQLHDRVHNVGWIITSCSTNLLDRCHKFILVPSLFINCHKDIRCFISIGRVSHYLLNQMSMSEQPTPILVYQLNTTYVIHVLTMSEPPAICITNCPHCGQSHWAKHWKYTCQKDHKWLLHFFYKKYILISPKY